MNVRWLSAAPFVPAIALIVAGTVAAQVKQEKREQDGRDAARLREAEKRAAVEAAARRADAVQQVRNVWPDEQFERWVFQSSGQQDGTAAGARRRLEAMLDLQVDEIDRVCHLAAGQKQKIRLMGQG